MRVLIPEPVPKEIENLYPQLKGIMKRNFGSSLRQGFLGGAKEYLVVSPDEITVDGDECDKLGVSYKAFVTQSERCNRPAGTCLNNQPAHLWYRDKVGRFIFRRRHHNIKGICRKQS